MAKTLKQNFKTENNTGFASQPNSQGNRLINKNGTVNVVRRGLPFLERLNFFHALISIRWSVFSCVVILFYVVMNIFFALVYYLIGVENLNGTITNSEIDKFLESFFFSTQTFATVGYGRINPTGILTNIVASLEALLGVLSLAVVTSLLYSRFSRPKINLVYSKFMLLAPYQDKKALMFRLANAENELLIECQIELLASFIAIENEKSVRKFITLPLELNRIATLAANWTVVHPLDEESPFTNFTAEDMAASEVEFMINLKAFDNTYSQTIHTRTSYRYDEIIWGAKFKKMFHRSEDGFTTVLQMDLISDYELVDLNLIEIK